MEIDTFRFTQADCKTFERLLRQEMELLEGLFRDGVFTPAPKVGGFELEAYLVAADLKSHPDYRALSGTLGRPLGGAGAGRLQRRDKQHPPAPCEGTP